MAILRPSPGFGAKAPRLALASVMTKSTIKPTINGLQRGQYVRNSAIDVRNSRLERIKEENQRERDGYSPAIARLRS